MVDKLEALKKKREQINARIQKMQSAEKSRERKQDTRRKILIGAYFLDQAKKNNNVDKLCEIMKHYVTRDSDKKLFE